jgi:hypothetical protein
MFRVPSLAFRVVGGEPADETWTDTTWTAWTMGRDNSHCEDTMKEASVWYPSPAASSRMRGRGNGSHVHSLGGRVSLGSARVQARELEASKGGLEAGQGKLR